MPGISMSVSDDVGLVLRGPAPAPRARTRLADDLEVALDFEQRAQRAEHHAPDLRR